MHLVGNREWRFTGGWVLGDVARAIGTWQRFFALGDSIRARLVMLALLSTAPLLLLAAVNASQDLTAARQDAQLEALRVAQLHADLIDEHVQAVDTLLRALSTTVSIEPADAALNEELLRSVLQQLPPPYTGLFFSPATGQLGPGSGLMFVSSSPSVAARGVVLCRPVIGRDGQVVAVLNAATRLDRLPRLETRDLPSGSTIMILDERGVVLAHSPDYDAWVGRDLSDRPYVQEALQHRLGSGELVSADGVTRLSAFTTATRAPWVVYVGLPSEIVLGSSRVALLRNLWFGVVALAAAVLVAWLLAGRITDPLRRLAADAAALGRGDLSRRARADGRGETAVLAGVFNQMAEDVEHYVAGLAASQLREQAARLAAEAATTQIAVRERRLQDLVRRLQVAQEEERRRVAYEIHDGLAQVAAAAHQHLQTFADYHSPESTTGRQALERTVELVQRTVREARRLIAGLRPTVLDDFGLATAIRLEVEALRGEGWQVTYDEDLSDQRLAPQIETALFRVAQEALTNVRKHAGRARVAVALEQHDDLVRLEVRDWGRGFGALGPQDRPRPGERVGLLSMHERVALLGGHCTVDSQPGSGTQVIAEVPLARLDGAGEKDAG
jgi:signal transduction histidine kinase